MDNTNNNNKAQKNGQFDSNTIEQLMAADEAFLIEADFWANDEPYFDEEKEYEKMCDYKAFLREQPEYEYRIY